MPLAAINGISTLVWTKLENPENLRYILDLGHNWEFIVVRGRKRISQNTCRFEDLSFAFLLAI